MALPDMVGFVVKDMRETLAFYRLLGLDIPEGAESEGHVEVITPNGYRLAWDTEDIIASFHPTWDPQAKRGRIGVAFKCDSPADVDALYQKVIAAGHHSELAPFDAVWGQRYATVQDPDGNGIDLFCAL